MKKAKILVLISLTICLIAMATTAFLYVKQDQYANEIEILNLELEKSKLQLEESTANLIEIAKRLDSLLVPGTNSDYATTILRDETKVAIKKLEVTELIHNIFSPIKSQRLPSTEKLTTNWTKDEHLIPYLLSYASDRFGQESYNMSGIINAIVVLNRMDGKLLEQNRDKISEFIDEVELLENRKQTQDYLEILKDRMK